MYFHVYNLYFSNCYNDASEILTVNVSKMLSKRGLEKKH